MSDCLLSVIIPVYNAQPFLEDCVESVVKLGIDNTEIILVNDGSTDGSKQICLKLAATYSNVVFIDSPNCGVSHARNLGIAHARGNWITFLDSDDQLIAESCMDALVDCLLHGNDELLLFGFVRDYYKNTYLDHTIKKEFPVFQEQQKNTIRLNIYGNGLVLFQNEAPDSACAKFFRKSIIRSGNIRFMEGVTCREDTIFVLDYLCQICSVTFINEYYYHYRIENNETYSFRREMPIADLVLLINRYQLFLECCGADQALMKKVAYFEYQTFLGGVIHFSAVKYTPSVKALYKYIKAAGDEVAIAKNLRILDLQGKSGFHKVFVWLFNHKHWILLTLLCRIRFWNL